MLLLGLLLIGGLPTATAVSLEYHRFENAVERNLVCTDGTPAGYYSKESESGSNTWYIHLQGRPWCYDYESCKKRADIDQVETTDPTTNFPTLEKFGIFDVLQQDNLIYVPDCSGDAWLGNTSRWGHNFRGRAIVHVLLQELPFQENSTVLLAGCSAGARGAMVHLDFLRPLLPPGISVRGVLDSPAWQDLPLHDPQQGTSLAEQTRLAYELFSPPISPWCQSAFANQTDTWKCLFAEYALPHVQEDYFLFSYLDDSFQLHTDLNTKPPFGPNQLTFARSLAARINHTIMAAAAAGKAVHAPACYGHGVIEHFDHFENVSAAGVTVAQLFVAWLSQPMANSTLSPHAIPKAAVDRCTTFNCGRGCPAHSPSFVHKQEQERDREHEDEQQEEEEPSDDEEKEPRRVIKSTLPMWLLAVFSASGGLIVLTGSVSGYILYKRRQERAAFDKIYMPLTPLDGDDAPYWPNNSLQFSPTLEL
ncbi:hypothetical protein CYMTET_8785 [Cymbomonas tetramitiformis]|uniref:Pectin acetylesterase n=1 Tax=Cymbomonas tetramitiformis TaxID=36881 RepID=A0AAE0GSF9_9CHLO|nr:hypothetical protein CYMTET_8785 [Cymbomonas tetramitiformis]